MIIYIVLAAVGILFVLWLWAIAPAVTEKTELKKLAKFDYAHRGLYSNENGIPENSLKAFALAAKSGFGIELDVQLTKDKEIVIHHDLDLARTCKIEKRIDQLTYKELCSYTLFGTEERIPLFADGLAVVCGGAPLIIEIKAYSPAEEICPLVWEALQHYEGAYCIESFDPRIVQWFRKHQPKVVRGQLMTHVESTKQLSAFSAFAGRNLLTNFLTRPHFEAYNFLYRKNISLQLAKNLLGMQEVSWTLRSPQQYQEAKKENAICIFEGFVPNEPELGGKKSVFQEARTTAASLIVMKDS